jgi:hypothetical protein
MATREPKDLAGACGRAISESMNDSSVQEHVEPFKKGRPSRRPDNFWIVGYSESAGINRHVGVSKEGWRIQ